MNTKLAVTLLALMAVCASASLIKRKTSDYSYNNDTSDDADHSWDFYVLRIEWAGGYQSDKWPSCVKTWTLHGLWPTRNDTTYPSTCNSTPFDIDKLDNITKTMECSWPSCCSSNEDFWSHEWSKHGTCAMSNKYTSDIQQYFGTALDLNANYDIYSILENAGITPSYSRSYTDTEIRNAISDALGTTPVLTCTSSRLMSADLCISKSIRNYQCLPAFTKDDNCDGTVWYNPPKYSSGSSSN